MSKSIAQIRNEAAAALSPERKQQWEQFLTPAPVAEQAAGLFTPAVEPVRILDLGSGTGILAAMVAAHAPAGSGVTAIEQDTDLAKASEVSIRQVCDDVEVIAKSVFDVLLDDRFDRVILNPPYKKISPVTIPTASGGVKITNLYTAFLVIAIQALAERGECVAIIPRSWMNGEYFKMMDFDKYWEIAEPKLKEAVKTPGIDLKFVGELLKTRLETLNDIPSLIDFIDELPEYSTELYIHKKMKTTEEIALSSLKLVLPVLEKQEKWDNDSLYEKLMELAKENGLKNGQILWPVRTALSGKPSSPGGATELAVILGKEETLKRISTGIELLEK